MAGSGKRKRHSYVRFFMDDWAGGTMRMGRVVRSVYFDICLYNWDKVKPMPRAEAILCFADLGAQGDDIIAALLDAGNLQQNDEGYYAPRAIAEAEHAFGQWAARSRGGSKRHGKSEEGEQEESFSIPDEDAPPVERRAAPRTFDSDSVMVAWNEFAKANGLSAIRTLTAERRLALGDRLAEHGERAIIEAIPTIAESEFLMGRGPKSTGWKANFDWLLRSEPCAKLIERSTDYFPNAGKAARKPGYVPQTVDELRRAADFQDTQGKAGQQQAAEWRRQADELEAGQVDTA